MANQIIVALPRVTDANGDPVSGALAYFYQTGTTTPVTIYSDAAATTPHTNPVVADSGGRFAQVFYSGGTEVKVVIKTSAGATLYQYDPAPMTKNTASGAADISFSPVTYNSATDVQQAIENMTMNVSAFAKTILDDGDAGTVRATINAMSRFVATVTDWDDAIDFGAYVADSSAANAPAVAAFNGFVVQNNADTSIHQLLFRQGSDEVWHRRFLSTWQPWRKLLDTGNFDELPYTSSAQTITTAGALALAHGLGAVPSFHTATLKCITTDAGYAVNDVIAVHVGAGGSTKANSAYYNSTNVVVKFSDQTNCFTAAHKTTGAATALDNAKWQLIIKAYP